MFEYIKFQTETIILAILLQQTIFVDYFHINTFGNLKFDLIYDI